MVSVEVEREKRKREKERIHKKEKQFFTHNTCSLTHITLLRLTLSLSFILEFDRLLEKHATETGLPVIVDFYSDGCGPCRMMAPVFKKLAQQVGQDKAVFCKVDTNTMYELSSRYQIRSLPTFVFFVGGQKWNQFSGAGEAQLQQMTSQAIRQAELDNVRLEKSHLKEFYKQVDPTKTDEAVEAVYQKCAEMTKRSRDCVGGPANQLVRRLKQKYKSGPKLTPRFTEEDRKPKPTPENETLKSSSSSSANKPNLHLATREELEEELERRLDEERDAQVEQEDDDDAEFEHSWAPSGFPERVVIVGGGPAGISAAIYAARAGLSPLVICPPLGGQLQGKGVDVENYPGLHNMTGPGVIAAMREQAAAFGAVFEADVVTKVDVSQRPMVVHTNSSTTIPTHSLIVATGAESKWLGVPGEWDMRGGGVSSCATCDGALYRGRDVVVVGGGDAAMEDALVLARTSKSVQHPSIKIQWNSVVKEIVGEAVKRQSDEDKVVDLDEETNKAVTGVILSNAETQKESQLACDAVFIAIGHTPATSFLKDIVEFEENNPGYIKTFGSSTKTSVPGIFAAGDVADNVYRQAITSAGSGAAAALDAERWLSEEGLGNEEAELEAELMAEVMGGNDKVDLAYNAYEDAGGRVEGMKESIGIEL
jgi:thioredoxin reductase (NADPH)